MANRKIWLSLAAALLLLGTLAAQQMPQATYDDDDQPVMQSSQATPENPALHTRPVAKPSAAEPATHPATAYRSRLASELPTGTAIYFQLQKTISSSEAKRGETFAGMVTRPVLVEGRTVIPVGCTVTGHVVRSSSPRRIKGRPMLQLRPDEITFPDGSKRPMSAMIVDTDPSRSLSVDDEGRIRGRGRSSADNLETVVVTAAGAGTGAVIAGPAGALLGAGAGATVTTAHWLAKHRTVEIGVGTTLIAELNRPMSLAVPTHHESRGD
jgi:hypothetical protein